MKCDGSQMLASSIKPRKTPNGEIYSLRLGEGKPRVRPKYSLIINYTCEENQIFIIDYLS